jgi:hypothetical protein
MNESPILIHHLLVAPLAIFFFDLLGSESGREAGSKKGLSRIDHLRPDFSRPFAWHGARRQQAIGHDRTPSRRLMPFGHFIARSG